MFLRINYENYQDIFDIDIDFCMNITIYFKSRYLFRYQYFYSSAHLIGPLTGKTLVDRHFIELLLIHVLQIFVENSTKYRLKVIQLCQTNDMLTCAKRILCDKVTNTLSVFILNDTRGMIRIMNLSLGEPL